MPLPNTYIECETSWAITLKAYDALKVYAWPFLLASSASQDFFLRPSEAFSINAVLRNQQPIISNSILRTSISSVVDFAIP